MTEPKATQSGASNSIVIKGARHNNLKNIDVVIPRNKLVVITGVSGSGKSSLAFDTLFAEGQRRYIESLSAYVRQFVGKINKPEVDFIKGLSPAIAIQQKVNTTNPRSTVGTTTEIYDYLKLLYARAGITYSPTTGKAVKRHSVNDVLDYVKTLPNDTKIQILCPLVNQLDRNMVDELNVALQKGFTRVYAGNKVSKIEDILSVMSQKTSSQERKALDKILTSEHLYLLIDRLVFQPEMGFERLADSVQTAFYEGHGKCFLHINETTGIEQTVEFSDIFEEDGIRFEEPSIDLFTFNNPFGACKKCEGFGSVIGIDEEKVIPDKSLSIFDEAVACWKGEKMTEWRDDFIKQALKNDFPIHRPYYQLTEDELSLLWNGNAQVNGIDQFFEFLQENSYKIQYRVMLSRFKGKTVCPECKGTRLRKDANYVKINGKGISDLVLLPIDELFSFFETIKLNEYQINVSKRILTEINSRLAFLLSVGLGYLTLNRDARTLSGGESQRIQIVTSLGSPLTGSLYILDEPSIGLHPKDTEMLISVLIKLRNLKNTVIVVEHDEDIMRSADHIIDIGPYAGYKGGEICFNGSFNELLLNGKTLTSAYLKGELDIAIPERKKPKYFLHIKQAFKHNLKRVDVSIALNCMSVITGVSGSGKSTLVSEVLLPSLQHMLRNKNGEAKNCISLTGDLNRITEIEYIDQNPIGRSSRSNPATYIKAYDGIRTLMASQNTAKQRGYSPAYFSFNVDGGRCPVCKGDGYITVEMQFMADLHLDCEECKGTRFRKEILDVTFNGKNIDDILNLTVDEAVDFFHERKEIHDKLAVLQSVGLGYLKLGQPSNNLSGGEAQRIKLAYFLNEGSKTEPILFVFDEPTTGLHFHDIHYLLQSFRKLVENGHSLLVIEHNLDVIKCADWLIDLGPEGGKKGGEVVFQGVPEDIIHSTNSVTKEFLLPKLKLLSV